MLYFVKTKITPAKNNQDIFVIREFIVSAKDEENALSEVLVFERTQLESFEERYGDVNMNVEVKKLDVSVIELPKGFIQ